MSYFSVDLHQAGCVALTDRSDIQKLSDTSHFTFGLSNQMFKLAHSMLQCLLFGWSFLILDKFGSCIHQKSLVESRCLFNFESTAEAFTREFQHPVVFIDRENLSKHSCLEVVNVFYGLHRGTTREKCITVTSEFMAFQGTNKNLPWVNSNRLWSSLCVPRGQDFNDLFRQDPAPGVCKNLYIELKMYLFQSNSENEQRSFLNVTFQVLEEIPYAFRIDSEFLLNIAFTGVTPRMEFYPKAIEKRTRFFQTLRAIQSPSWLNIEKKPYFLCRFPDHQEYNLTDTDYITLVHLRLETDALNHWSRRNHLTMEDFQKRLILMYQSALRLAQDRFNRFNRLDSTNTITSDRLSRHVILFLTHEPAQLFVLLNEQQQQQSGLIYLYIDTHQKTRYIQKTLGHQGRELEALMDLDLVKMLAHRCHTYIGCHNVEKHRGSTFSLLNMLHLPSSAHILLDLDDLSEPLQIYGDNEFSPSEKGIHILTEKSCNFWCQSHREINDYKNIQNLTDVSPFFQLSFTPVLCVYSYYDGNDKIKNVNTVQDNFAFFLKASQIHMIQKWQLVIVHHIDYESDPPLVIPPVLQNHVIVIRRANRGYDFGAWGYCIEILRPYLSYFKYFIFLNSSVRGPFIPRWLVSSSDTSNTFHHWTEHVTSHLSERIKLVGLTVCYRPWVPHVQSMFWATDRTGLDVLIRQDILRPHNDEISLTNVIRGYELEMTQIIVQAGYDYYAFQASESQFVRDREDHLITGPRPNTDVHSRGSYFGLTPHPFELLFIKTNRISDVNVQKLTEFVIKSPDTLQNDSLPSSTNIMQIQERFTLNNGRALIFVLYHDDKSKSEAPQGYLWSQLYKLKRSRFMESQILPHLHLWCQMKWTTPSLSYIGMIPYSIGKKWGNFFYQLDLKHFENNAFQADFVWFYYKCPLNLLDHATKHHPRFQDIWSRLLTLLNCPPETILDTRIPFAPCNAFIARPECMAHYVDFGLKAMHWLQTDAQLLTWCQEDSEYKGALSPVECQSIFDRPYYTYEPFIMERLPCYFAWLHKCKVLMKTL